MRQRQGRENGYAMVAAVASIALLASISLMMVAAARGAIAMASAELDRARLLAAADAGVALTLQELLQPNAIARVPINGTVQQKTYAGYRLSIQIEDERGKIALNLINEEQTEAMFAAFGVTGTALEQAVDGFLDWRDEDDSPRLMGAEVDDYEKLGQSPRNGPLLSVGELALIRGVGPALAAKIAPDATLTFGTRGEFDPRFASPISRAVMADKPDAGAIGAGDSSEIQPIEATQLGNQDSLINRPLTIRVDASDGHGGGARRQLVVELTGARRLPYVVRARD